MVRNMLEATRLACNLSRVKGRTSDQWLEAIDAHRLATSGSARILGMQEHQPAGLHLAIRPISSS